MKTQIFKTFSLSELRADLGLSCVQADALAGIPICSLRGAERPGAIAQGQLASWFSSPVPPFT